MTLNIILYIYSVIRISQTLSVDNPHANYDKTCVNFDNLDITSDKLDITSDMLSMQTGVAG